MFYKTSRLTFVEADPFDLGPSGWGGVREAIRVKLTVDGKTLNAFVTHLDWPADDDWTDANEEHVRNRNNLAAKLDLFSGYKIFGGDLNAPYTGNWSSEPPSPLWIRAPSILASSGHRPDIGHECREAHLLRPTLPVAELAPRSHLRDERPDPGSRAGARHENAQMLPGSGRDTNTEIISQRIDPRP